MSVGVEDIYVFAGPQSIGMQLIAAEKIADLEVEPVIRTRSLKIDKRLNGTLSEKIDSLDFGSI